MIREVIQRRRGWVLAGLVGLMPLCVQAQSTVQLRDGVLMDADSRRVILMTADGGIEAVGLHDGATQWRQPAAARPLAMFGSVIWAQAAPTQPEGDLSIVTLNTEGELTGRARVEIPSRAWTSVDDGLGRQFRIVAEGDSPVPSFRWRSEERLIKGALAAVTPPPEAPGSDPRMRSSAPKSLKVEEGRFDLATGQARSLPQEADQLWPSQVQRLPAAKDASADERRYLSADGKVILVSRKVADDRQWQRYRWRLLDRQSGAQLGELLSHVAWAPFAVIDNTLVVEQRPWARQRDGELETSPLLLIAIGLAEGDELWRREIRDTTFHGPYPS